MYLREDPMKLTFSPALYRLTRSMRDNTSPEQKDKCDYDESQTDGNIHKSWHSMQSIAVTTHPQSKLYRLINTCVICTFTDAND